MPDGHIRTVSSRNLAKAYTFEAGMEHKGFISYKIILLTFYKFSVTGMAGVLKSEIKQDAAMGGNTEAKEAALAEIEKKAAETTSSQIDTLAKANQELKEAAGTEQDNGTDKTHKDKEETGSTQKSNINNTEKTNDAENENGIETQAADTNITAGVTPPPVSYRPVDISL